MRECRDLGPFTVSRSIRIPLNHTILSGILNPYVQSRNRTRGRWPVDRRSTRSSRRLDIWGIAQRGDHTRPSARASSTRGTTGPRRAASGCGYSLLYRGRIARVAMAVNPRLARARGTTPIWMVPQTSIRIASNAATDRLGGLRVCVSRKGRTRASNPCPYCQTDWTAPGGLVTR